MEQIHTFTPAPVTFDLFSVEPGLDPRLSPKDKPRAATEREVKAYMADLAHRRGLPPCDHVELHWKQYPGNRSAGRYCIGATFGQIMRGGYWCDKAREWIEPEYEPGSYSVLTPGFQMANSVTMETLGDAGEMLASQTLPAEPKKGGVIWSRDDVRKAHGPVAKVAKPRKGKVAPVAIEPVPVAVEPVAPPTAHTPPQAPIPVYAGPEVVRVMSRVVGGMPYGHLQEDRFTVGQAGGWPATTCEDLARWHWNREGRETAYGEGYASQNEALAALDAFIAAETAPQEPQERESDLAPPPVALDAPNALEGPELPPVEHIPAEPDPLADVLARLEAIEAALAGGLSAESSATPSGGIAPSTGELAHPGAPVAQQRRTPAHERAIRRAWAERRAGRTHRALRQQAEADFATQQAMAAEVKAELKVAWARQNTIATKRHRSTLLARDLQKRLAAEYRLMDRANEKRREAEEAAREWSRKEEAERNRANRAEKALADLRRDLADPSQPERASDLALLLQRAERAETANRALAQRAERAERALQDGAARVEEIVSRMARAEAELRAMKAAA